MNETSQNPDTSSARNDGESPKNPVAQAIAWVLDTIRGRYFFVMGIILLAVSVTILTSARNELSGDRRSILDGMTGRGTVRILDSAVRILPQSSPEAKMDPGRALWHHDFLFEYRIELSYLNNPVIKTYLANRSRDLTDIGRFWPNLEKASDFFTSAMTIKMDSGLYRLLKDTPAHAGSTFSVLDAPKDAPKEQKYFMGSQFDQFWVWIDRPGDALALRWYSDSRDRTIPVRYNPVNPEDFLYESQYSIAIQNENHVQSMIGAVILAGFGLFILLFAVTMLMQGSSKYIWLLLYVGTVLLVSIGSRHLQSAIDYVGIPEMAKFFITEWNRSMDFRTKIGFLREVTEADTADLTELRVDFEHSRYRDLFSYFELSPNDSGYGSFVEARQDMAFQIRDQFVNLQVKDQFRFFKILDNHMNHHREGWDGPFLETVRTIALDETRSTNLRSWAISALCDMCLARNDPAMTDFIYRQYVTGEGEIRSLWQRFFFNYLDAEGFSTDLNSSDPIHIKRALAIWMDDHHFLEDVKKHVPRLKELSNFPDPEIREMALKKWNSRDDWEK